MSGHIHILPLAHFINEGIVESSYQADQLVNATWQAFIYLLGIDEQDDFPNGYDGAEILESILLDENESPLKN